MPLPHLWPPNKLCMSRIRIAEALAAHGASSDELLWSATFALTALAREGSLVRAQALCSMARCRGLLPLLQRCLQAHQAR